MKKHRVCQEFHIHDIKPIDRLELFGIEITYQSFIRDITIRFELIRLYTLGKNKAWWAVYSYVDGSMVSAINQGNGMNKVLYLPGYFDGSYKTSGLARKAIREAIGKLKIVKGF